MATDSNYIPAAVEAYNGLLAAAGKMIRRLQQNPVGTPQGDVKAFQFAWNTTRGIVAGELNNLVREQTGYEDAAYQFDERGQKIVGKGLVTDGKYGPGTAYALAYTLLAKTEPGEAVLPPPPLIQSMPTRARGMPVWVADNQSTLQNLLLPLAVEASTVDPPSPVPQPTAPPPVSLPADVVREALKAQQTPQTASPGPEPTTEDVVDFGPDETPPIVAVTKGERSNVPLLVFGVGVLVFGGIALYAKKRKS